MEASFISARGVEKFYRSLRRRTQALSGVDLEVGQGEVVGLIGPNGAGKTTFLTCLLGLLRPDRGTITVGGRLPDDLAVRARTGYMPERLGFERELTGREFLRQHARLAGLPRAQVGESLQRAQQRVELREEALGRPLRTYSRGMLQRIGLAQALLGSPDLLFLDEPASGMDPTGVALVREIILAERARGVTVVLNSHQLQEVERVCDRVAFLSGGRVERLEILRDDSRSTEAWEVRVEPGQDEAAVAALAAAGLAAGRRAAAIVHVELAPGEVGRIAPALVGAGVTLLGLARVTTRLEELFTNGGTRG